jgi:hypothetical protein
MERTSSFIKVWFFPRRSSIPSALANGAADLDTATLGTPTAFFVNNQCNIDRFFGDHNIIINLTFCGDWAGATVCDRIPRLRTARLMAFASSTRMEALATVWTMSTTTLALSLRHTGILLPSAYTSDHKDHLDIRSSVPIGYLFGIPYLHSFTSATSQLFVIIPQVITVHPQSAMYTTAVRQRLMKQGSCEQLALSHTHDTSTHSVVHLLLFIFLYYMCTMVGMNQVALPKIWYRRQILGPISSYCALVWQDV